MKRQSTEPASLVECPVCNHFVHGSEEETLKHIDRCLRRKPTASMAELEEEEFPFEEHEVPAACGAGGDGNVSSDEMQIPTKKIRTASRTLSTRKRGRPARLSESAVTRSSISYDANNNNNANSNDDNDVSDRSIIATATDSDECDDRCHGEELYIPSADDRDSDSDSVDATRATTGTGTGIGTGIVEDDWNETLFRVRLDKYLDELGGGDDGGADAASGSLTATVAADVDAADEVGRVAHLLCPTTWAAMFPYQREGVRWLHNLHRQGAGGILGDEMGLGKTVQVCVHFALLAAQNIGAGADARSSSSSRSSSRSNDHRQLHHRTVPAPTRIPTVDCSIFLIACPITVLHHWVNEFHRWVPFLRVLVLHTSMSSRFAQVLQAGGGRSGLLDVLRGIRCNPVNSRGVVVLVSYDGLKMYSRDTLLNIASGSRGSSSSRASVTPTTGWAAVCIDEGQKIRNPVTSVSSICKLLPSYHRIILSGTPIQNSLKELWSLFDFICPSLLGNTLEVFDRDFASVIRAGNYKSSSTLVKEMAIRTAYTLQRIIAPYLLRRKKKDLQDVARLPDKTEHVLFCRLTDTQRDAYINVISSDEVKLVLDKRYSAFRAITHLRKICNHPSLALYTGKLAWSGWTGAAGTTTVIGTCNGYPVDFQDSGKLVVLSKILPQWRAEGHKVLIFTQTQSMLQLVQLMLAHLGRRAEAEKTEAGVEAAAGAGADVGAAGVGVGDRFRYIRLDGSTPVSRREELISLFNSDPSVFAMVLTTKTGGVGISLTAANRVVIMDPDWNPQTDIQARERAWRIGQSRPVTVFRLISRGTIEEVIYKRQVFKLMLTGRILDNPRQRALFSRSDLSELFQLVDGSGRGGGGEQHLQQRGRGRGRMVHHRNSTANEVEKVIHYHRAGSGGTLPSVVEYKSGADYHNLLSDLPEEGHVELSSTPLSLSSPSRILPPKASLTEAISHPVATTTTTTAAIIPTVRVPVPSVVVGEEGEIEEEEEVNPVLVSNTTAAVAAAEEGKEEAVIVAGEGEVELDLNEDLYQDPDLNLGLDGELLAECFPDPTSLLLNNPHAAQQLDLGEIEQMFNIDLLLDEDADEDEDGDRVMEGSDGDGDGDGDGRSSSSSSGAATTQQQQLDRDRDKELLRALFDGDDITAVYDHHFAESTNDAAGSGGSAANYTREFAHRTVDRTLSSFTSDTLTDSSYCNSNSSDSHNSADADSVSHRSAATVSSGSMLANLRSNIRAAVPGGGGGSYSPATATATTTARGSHTQRQRQRQQRGADIVPVRDSVMTRMIKLFKSQPPQQQYASRTSLSPSQGRGGLSSSELLNAFSYLGDSHAPLFKSILQRVAQLRQGTWYLREEYL